MADDAPNPMAESGVTIQSDSEQYSGAEELPSDDGPSSSLSSSDHPIILYRPPTLWSLFRGAAINLILPFINGMMMGFGELFAHEFAFRLGWSSTRVFPLSRRQAHPVGPGVELRERRPPSPLPGVEDMAQLE